MHDHIPVDRLHAGRPVTALIRGERHEGATVTFFEAVDLGVNALGGRAVRRRVSLRLADGTELSLLNALNAMYWTPEYTEREWCSECRRRVEVEERSNESTYEGSHEVGFQVARMVCGHTKVSAGRVIGASPGGEAAAEAMAGAATQSRLARSAAWNDQ